MPHYRWMIVAAGGLLGCVGAGTMFALAVFLQPMADAAGWSRAGISSAMTINFLVMGPAGFFWGALSDRIGPRPVLIAGSLLLGLGAVLSSQASSLLMFQIVYGVLIGAGVGVVDDLRLCTYAEPKKYFSHRWATHKGIPTGRQLSVIGLGGL